MLGQELRWLSVWSELSAEEVHRRERLVEMVTRHIVQYCAATTATATTAATTTPTNLTPPLPSMR